MEMTNPNITAIIVMAAVYTGIGWLWYTKLFADMMACPSTQKNHEECKACWKCYLVEFILACVMGYVLSMFVLASAADTVMSGLKVGFWAWLGFVATTMLSKALWSHKPMTKFYVSSGFYLVMLLIMGATFAVWR
jgi:hypothetical protein